MLIFLVGFMGSGKTSFLQKCQRFSPSHQWIIEDLDKTILRGWGEGVERDLGELIDKVGLAEFREYEREALQRVLQRHKQGSTKNSLVALGGGCLGEEGDHPNWNLIVQSGVEDTFIVWLDTPFEECWRRIEGSRERPLAGLGKEELRRLHQKRGPVYRRADLTLDVEQADQIETPDDLLALLQRGKN